MCGQEGEGRRAAARPTVAACGARSHGPAPERQPLSDRRTAVARVVAAMSARRRQVPLAAAATRWARPSCMVPCSVSTSRGDTPASRGREACWKASTTGAPVPKLTLARPSISNPCRGCRCEARKPCLEGDDTARGVDGHDKRRFSPDNVSRHGFRARTVEKCALFFLCPAIFSGGRSDND